MIVGVCENCGLIVKIEALESHIRHRHGLPHGPSLTSTVSSSRNTLSNSRGSSGGRGNVIKPVRVDLTKITAKLKQESRGSSKGSRYKPFFEPPMKNMTNLLCRSLTSCPPPSRSKTPTPDKELVSPYVAQELSLDKHLPMIKVVSESYLTKYDPDVDVDITSRWVKLDIFSTKKNHYNISCFCPLFKSFLNDIHTLVCWFYSCFQTISWNLSITKFVKLFNIFRNLSLNLPLKAQSKESNFCTFFQICKMFVLQWKALSNLCHCSLASTPLAFCCFCI